jgi:hypothetical protein
MAPANMADARAGRTSFLCGRRGGTSGGFREAVMLVLPAQGSCQCGACRYRVDAQPYVAYACHCTACQRLTSSAFLLCMQVAAESVAVTAGSPSTCLRVADSGNRLVTWFCPACGSSLFAENSSRPRVRTVHAGTLERPGEVAISAHIWVSHKLPWVVLPESHRVFDGPGDWTPDYARDPLRYRAP